jgi:hypothetical protein
MPGPGLSRYFAQLLGATICLLIGTPVEDFDYVDQVLPDRRSPPRLGAAQIDHIDARDRRGQPYLDLERWLSRSETGRDPLLKEQAD